ncbi:MAG: pyridoxamine 5'-phosphate oxidase family protein [Candidatus Hodarchaeota archaeon]
MGIPTVDEVLGVDRNVFLATAEGDQPRVRPVTMVKNEGSFYVITGSENAKTHQIRKNAKVEVVTLVKHEEHTGYVRFDAIAKIITDSIIRERVAKATSFFSEYFDSPNDPKYALIHLIPQKGEYLKPGQMYPEPFTL